MEQAVKLTDGLSLIQLLDLYNLLSRIIKKFSRTTVRTSLPKVRKYSKYTLILKTLRFETKHDSVLKVTNKKLSLNNFQLVLPINLLQK